MWHIYNLIRVGDVVRGSTIRKVSCAIDFFTHYIYHFYGYFDLLLSFSNCLSFCFDTLLVGQNVNEWSVPDMYTPRSSANYVQFSCFWATKGHPSQFALFVAEDFERNAVHLLKKATTSWKKHPISISSILYSLVRLRTTNRKKIPPIFLHLLDLSRICGVVVFASLRIWARVLKSFWILPFKWPCDIEQVH